jgi:hypothetical protein
MRPDANEASISASSAVAGLHHEEAGVEVAEARGERAGVAGVGAEAAAGRALGGGLAPPK